MAHDLIKENMHIQFCYALPGSSPNLMHLNLSAQAKIADIVHCLEDGQRQIVQDLLLTGSVWAVFGKKKTATHPLQEGDRVELCRPLIADPMSARRHRAKREHKSGKM